MHTPKVPSDKIEVRVNMSSKPRSDSNERMQREINRQKEERRNYEAEMMDIDEEVGANMGDLRMGQRMMLPDFFYNTKIADVLDNSVFDK